jgi:hypothetical protein
MTYDLEGIEILDDDGKAINFNPIAEEAKKMVRKFLVLVSPEQDVELEHVFSLPKLGVQVTLTVGKDNGSK